MASTLNPSFTLGTHVAAMLVKQLLETHTSPFIIIRPSFMQPQWDNDLRAIMKDYKGVIMLADPSEFQRWASLIDMDRCTVIVDELYPDMLKTLVSTLKEKKFDLKRLLFLPALSIELFQKQYKEGLRVLDLEPTE